MTGDLREARLNAALASKGASSEPIYRLAVGLLAALRLKGDLLEFGAGTGQLTKQLRELGYQGRITCADILPRPEWLPNDNRWLETDLNRPLSLPEDAFDVIIATEVVEHLENPRAVFREFYRLLRPGGTLLLTTPNQESIRSLISLILRRHFVAFLDSSYPAHITALLQKDFERICAETSFGQPRFFYTDCGGIPRLPQIPWQRISFGLLRGRLFSDNVAIITTKA